MKFYFCFLFSLLVAAQVSAQGTVKMSAVKANDYGVVYSLPKTQITVKVTYKKTVYKRGEYYQYADQFLNMSNPITEDKVVYDIDHVDASTNGVPDKSRSYLVQFKSGTTAPFVTLSNEGLICSINDDYNFPAKVKTEEKKVVVAEDNPRSYLSEEILRATSESKQAELVAKQIYRLRESHNDILTGDADNMPPDGNAYKLVINQLDVQEKALTSMFMGTVTTETLTKEFAIDPDANGLNNFVLFRFSHKLGIVAANDLSGAPVTLSLINLNPNQHEELTPKQQAEMDKKFAKGIVFNVPSKASLELTYQDKKIFQQQCDVIQFGTQDVLTSKLFENNKKPIKIIFYPDLGAIKQIIQ